MELQQQKRGTPVSQHPCDVITLFSSKELFDPATQEHAKLFSARMFLCPGLSLYTFSGRALLGLSGSLAGIDAL